MNNKISKIALLIILLFSVYHLMRDILQIARVNTIFANMFHWEHFWCKPYCDYIFFPPQLFNIVAIPIILKRKKFGVLGILVLLTIPYGLWAWLAK